MSAAQGIGLGGAVVGGLIGSYFGPGGMMIGASLGMTVGSMVGGMLFPPKVPGQFGPRLNDRTIQTSTYGGPIPIGYGVMRIAGNVIWSTDILESAHTESVSAGGKGGGPRQEQTTYSYSISLAIGLCEGPIIGIRKIWTDGELFYDLTNPSPGINCPIRIYTGTETQTADAAIEADKGSGNVPGFRGLAYVVFDGLQLARWGNRVPNFEFEVVFNGSLSATTIATTNGNTTRGIAIDPGSGLVWAAQDNGANGGAVNVYEPVNMTLVQSFTAKSPSFLCYQPAYVTIESGLPVVKSARMWAGGYYPEILGGRVTSIEIETGVKAEYDVVVWKTPSHILFCPFAKYFPHVWVGCTDVTGAVLRIYLTDGTVEDLTPNIAGGLYSINDWVFGNGYVYLLDGRHKLLKLDRDAVIVASVQPYGVVQSAVSRVCYNPDEDCLYVSFETATGNGIYAVKKFDADLNTIWTKTFDANHVVREVVFHEGIGHVWIIVHDLTLGAGLNVAYRVNLSTGATVETIVSDVTGSGIVWAEAYPWSEFLVATDAAAPGRVLKIPLVEAATPSAPTLQSIVSDLSDRAGLGASEIDITGLSGTVKGYLVGQRMPVRGAVEPLQRAYFFDAVESDSKAKFVARGGASVVTIENDDVAAHVRDSALPAPAEQTRTQEVDLPNQLDVVYVDDALHYKTNTQYARRLTGSSEEKSTLEVPIVLSATKGKQVADVLLHDAWMERDKYVLLVTRKYLKLDPADPITYTDASGAAISLRIVAVKYSLPGLVRLECVAEDASIYTFANAGAEGSPLSESVPLIAPTMLTLLDIPMVQDADDDLGVYVAAGPFYE